MCLTVEEPESVVAIVGRRLSPLPGTTTAAVAVTADAATADVPRQALTEERSLATAADNATAAPLSSFNQLPSNMNCNLCNGASTAAPTDVTATTTAAAASTTATNPDCSSSSSPWRLVVCATGISVCYLTYGVLQERLLSSSSSSSSLHHNNRTGGLGASLMLLTQCVTNVAVALVWQRLYQHRQRNQHRQQVPTTDPTSFSSSNISPSKNRPTASLPHGLLILTAACYVTAMVCSNEAIGYVSYPVQVLAKSCKLIPTMLVGQLVERRLYRASEWMAALCISVGIVLFHTSSRPAPAAAVAKAAATAILNISNVVNTDPTAANTALVDHVHDNEYYGLWLLIGSLTMDGVLSGLQNFLKQARRPPNAVETMLYVNLYALLFLHPLCLVTGQWEAAVRSSSHSPSVWLRETASNLVLLNASAAAGQVFIFLCIAWFTPVITTTITTTRKFLTILLSVGLYGHAFTKQQWLSVGLVFVGLYVAILTTVRSGGGGGGNTKKIKQA